MLVRYTRAIDTRDWDLFRTCFADDVAADYGDIGSWEGVEALTAFMVSAHAGMGRTQHTLSEIVIDIEGEWSRSVASVHAVTELASGPDEWIDTVGTYEDRLHRVTGGWRITGRVFRVTESSLSPALVADGHRRREQDARS